MAVHTQQEGEKQYEEKVLYIRRVSKKTTGGNSISFSALMVVGDGKGKVGIGLGTGREVPQAIKKGIAKAKKRFVTVPLYKDTLPHDLRLKYKSARLLLKPAPPGTGLKLGGVVRIILDVAGVNNASGKIVGTRNQITNAYAVIEAIKKFTPRIVAKDTNKSDSNEAKTQPKVVAPQADSKQKKSVKKSESPVKKAKSTNAKKTASKKGKKTSSANVKKTKTTKAKKPKVTKT